MPMDFTLTVATGPDTGRVVTPRVPDPRYIIGRMTDCSLVLPEATVSRYHCLLEIRPDSVILHDFGSANGTYVNGRLLGKRDRTAETSGRETGEAVRLCDGDVVTLGRRSSLKVSLREKPETCTMGTSLLDDIFVSVMEEEAHAYEAAIPRDFDRITLLGRGGMGEVWKVRDPATGKIYALKSMLPNAAHNERTRNMFKREAEVARLLVHPNVVRTWQTNWSGDAFTILMDLCEGGNVEVLMKEKGGKLPLSTALYIILQVLSGLSYVHTARLSLRDSSGSLREVTGVVHRDLKPGNIFLADRSDKPRAMVADFGMAKAFDLAGFSNLSQSGTYMGTPAFMPRVQLKDYRYAKPNVDVWAAAASLYYMVTRSYPRNFREGRNPWAVVLQEKAVPIRERELKVPEALARVIDRALTEEPGFVYDSADEFRRDLIRAMPAELVSFCREVIE